MRDLGRVLSLARRHAGWLVVAAASMIVVTAATVFVFNLVRPIYDQVLRPDGTVRSVAEPRPGGLVSVFDRAADHAERTLEEWVGGNQTALLVLALAAVIVKNLFAFIARFASARFGLSTIRDLRQQFFDSLLVQNPGFFHSRSTAALVSRATNDLQLLREALAERFGDVAQDLVTVPVILAYLLFLDLRLTLATAVAAPLLLAPVVHLSRRLRHRAREVQERTGDISVVIDETVRGIRAVQNYGMSGFMADRFLRANQQHYRANLAARAIQAANAPVMEVVGAFGALAVIAYAAARITAADMTLGDFSAFVLAAYAVYNPLKRLNKFNLIAQHAAVAASRVFEILDAPVEVANRPGARPLPREAGGVRFEQVEFSYPDQRVVLRGLELDLPRGWTVALVGSSGAGKSTVAQLVPRFFDVDEGSVKVGGIDVRDLDLASLRAQIGLVTQEALLFNDTVRTNIACGRTGFGIDAVEAAANVADADAFIRDLPRGYETVVGEGGVSLSGGQRQRLAIARAVLAEPRILILDEATSALDPESERRIHDALASFAGDRTTLVITHRLATVRRADAIAVLAQGRIAELGGHDELWAANGHYRRMVEVQELT